MENCSSSSKTPIPISRPFSFTIGAEEIAIGNTFGTRFSKFRATPGNTFESPLDLLLAKHSARELNAGSWATRLGWLGPQLHCSTVAFLHQCRYLKIAISALVSMLLCQSLSAQSREHKGEAALRSKFIVSSSQGNLPVANQQRQREHRTGTRRDSALLSDAFVFTETTLIRTLAMDNTAVRELFRAMKSAIPGVCPNQSGPVDRDPKTVACEAAYAPSGVDCSRSGSLSVVVRPTRRCCRLLKSFVSRGRTTFRTLL